MEKNELNPIYTDQKMKRKYLLEFETLVGHINKYVRKLDDPEVTEKLSGVADIQKNYMIEKKGMTKEMIIKAGITAFQQSRTSLTFIPYDKDWMYEDGLTFKIGKEYELKYNLVSDFLISRLDVEGKKNLSNFIHKSVISLFKIISINH